MVISDPATGVSYWGTTNYTVARVDPDGTVNTLFLQVSGPTNPPIVASGVVDSVRKICL